MSFWDDAWDFVAPVAKPIVGATIAPITAAQSILKGNNVTTSLGNALASSTGGSTGALQGATGGALTSGKIGAVIGAVPLGSDAQRMLTSSYQATTQANLSNKELTQLGISNAKFGAIGGAYATVAPWAGANPQLAGLTAGAGVNFLKTGKIDVTGLGSGLTGVDLSPYKDYIDPALKEAKNQYFGDSKPSENAYAPSVARTPAGVLENLQGEGQPIAPMILLGAGILALYIYTRGKI